MLSNLRRFVACLCFVFACAFVCQSGASEIFDQATQYPYIVGLFIDSMKIHFLNIRNSGKSQWIDSETFKDSVWKVIPQMFFDVAAGKGWFERAEEGKLIDFGDISNFTPAEMNYVVLANMFVYPRWKLNALADDMKARYCASEDNEQKVNALKSAIGAAIDDVKIYVQQLGFFEVHIEECTAGPYWIAFPYTANCSAPIVLVKCADSNLTYEQSFNDTSGWIFSDFNDNEYIYKSGRHI